MKVLIKDLYNISDKKDYPINLKDIEIKDNIFIKGIKEVNGLISFYYDEEDKLCIDYELKGIMSCPDSITLENVDVPFEISDCDEVVTSENDEGFYFIDGLDIEDFISYIVIPEAPISVEKKGDSRYYSGDGWTICSEEAYNSMAREKVDPRLEKLLEYKEEE